MSENAKIQVEIVYIDSGNRQHSSGASFDSLASMATQIETFFDLDKIIRIEFIK